MELYTVLHQDRHADPEVEVFSDEQKAVEYARNTAKEFCRHPGDYEESIIADWVFHAIYSCEGDCVTVHKIVLDSKAS